MNFPPLIAFTGRAGSGKSTAAEALEKVGFKRVKFADPLKDMLRTLYGCAGLSGVEIERRIEGDLKQEKDGFLCGQTPRRAMQTLGTEWGRNLIGPDLWVSAWSGKVYSLLSEGVPVVVDDCRFGNEAEAVRKLGGKIVQVEGRNAGLAATHASEQFDLVPDEVISNTGSYHEFQAYIVALYSPISRADALDGGPYAEIWDSRKRAGATVRDLQEAYQALLMGDTNLRAEAARAIRHLGRAEGATRSPEGVTALLFYFDCIGAGLPFDADGMDTFLALMGAESPTGGL